tara:strand:+ start:842 stop:1321 length:480 start_codon:yes stop_codon:yes gene_type:complete
MHKYDYLYNKIHLFAREKYFYQELNLKDSITTRLYIMLLTFAFVLKYFKKNNLNKKTSQEIHDFFFRKIEIDFREMGFGDITVNKKMKDIIKLFHEIIIFCENWEYKMDNEKATYFEFLFEDNIKIRNFNKLVDYFDVYFSNFEDKSLYLDIKGILNSK